MKLTKEAEGKLQNIVIDMQKAEKFLLKDSTIIGTISNLTHAKDCTWTNAATGQAAGTFNKHIGNDLCYLNNAIRSLQHFLTSCNESETLNSLTHLNQ